MSIASEITRLQGLRNRIRAKLIALGEINDQTADLDECTRALEAMNPNVVTAGSVATRIGGSSSITVSAPTGYKTAVKALFALEPGLATTADTVAMFWKTTDSSPSFGAKMYDGTTPYNYGVTTGTGNVVIHVDDQGKVFEGTYRYIIEWE